MAQTNLRERAVVEKLNSMAVDLIAVTPTCDTDAIPDNDVIFDWVEIPNAVAVIGGTAIIQSIHLLDKAIKSTDKFIDEAYKLKKPDLKERKKFLGNKDYLKVKDHGMSYHSTPLNGDPGLKELEQYIGATSLNLLDEWGYDMSK